MFSTSVYSAPMPPQDDFVDHYQDSRFIQNQMVLGFAYALAYAETPEAIAALLTELRKAVLQPNTPETIAQRIQTLTWNLPTNYIDAPTEVSSTDVFTTSNEQGVIFDSVVTGLGLDAVTLAQAEVVDKAWDRYLATTPLATTRSSKQTFTDGYLASQAEKQVK